MREGINLPVGKFKCILIRIHAYCLYSGSIRTFTEEIEQFPVGAAGQIHDTYLFLLSDKRHGELFKHACQHPAPASHSPGRRRLQAVRIND